MPNKRSWLRWSAVIAVAFYLSLFLFNSITRVRQFSPDSMNYVDVARNIAVGRGISQSTLGYNQLYLFSPDSLIPTPLTSTPPLYPLLIALVSLLGLTVANAALVVPVAAFGLVLLLGYLLARETCGKETALVAVACLLIYQPLNFVAGFAWSEMLSVAFLFLSIWLLARMRVSKKQGAMVWIAFGAGLAAGLAFATRYALIPLFALGLITIVGEEGWNKLRLALYYVIGFGLPAGLVLAHNWISARVLIPAALASDRDLLSNGQDAAWSILGDYSTIGSAGEQAAAAGVILIAGGLTLALQRRLRELPGILVNNGRCLLLFWSAGYLAFVITLRTISYFSTIDDRIAVPAGAVLVIPAAALLYGIFRTWCQSVCGHLGKLRAPPANERSPISDRQTRSAAPLWVSKIQGRAAWPSDPLYGFIALIACMFSFGQLQLARNVPPYNFSQVIVGSERLTWISQETTDRDLVVGDGTVDVPFYLGRQAAVSFAGYPITVFLTYPTLTQFADHKCSLYQNIYLVLRDHSDWSYQDELHYYGRFMSDVSFGRLGSYPRIIPLVELSDATVFRVQCGD